MYAIAFDMMIADLRLHYGEPYNNAYFEINQILRKYNFYNTQGSVYMTENTDMSNLFRAISGTDSSSPIIPRKHGSYYL